MGDVERCRLIGGHVAIDFVNTLGGRSDDPDDEYLHRYDDLVRWTERVGLLESVCAAGLRKHARDDTTAAEQALRSGQRLRSSLDQLLRNLIEPSPSDHGAAVHSAYLAAISHAAPDFTNGLRWRWPDDPDDLDRPLWPIAVAAVDLLQSKLLQRLGRCQHCRWLFLDTSRQHNRRWCSMNECGAIIKMRRYRAAKRDL